MKRKLNEIDLKIISLLYEKDFNISGLNKEVGIAYKNFLPHIKLLLKEGIINIEKVDRGKSKTISLNINKKLTLKDFLDRLFNTYKLKGGSK